MASLKRSTCLHRFWRWLLKLCKTKAEDPDSSLSEIADLIVNDPALTDESARQDLEATLIYPADIIDLAVFDFNFGRCLLCKLLSGVPPTFMWTNFQKTV
jgi:hypothetical protein